MPFLLSPLLGRLLLAGAIAGGLAWGYLAIRGAGVDACNRTHAEAAAQAEAESHQQYLAALAWGEQISEQLAQTQRRLNDTKTEYLAYANGIVGNCPNALGLLADAAARGTTVPKTPGTPADPAAAFSAADIAGNIAENYARCHLNAEQLAALIAWHAGPEGALNGK